jgi:hypothetical protein
MLAAKKEKLHQTEQKLNRKKERLIDSFRKLKKRKTKIE